MAFGFRLLASYFSLRGQRKVTKSAAPAHPCARGISPSLYVNATQNNSPLRGSLRYSKIMVAAHRFEGGHNKGSEIFDMEKDKELLNITRFDYEKEGKAGQHGWWVRLQKNGKKFQNFFNDSKFGGKEEGLKAAKIFRDAVKLHLDDLPDINVTHKKARSNSGIVGVSRTEGLYKSKGRRYYRKAWIANWVNEAGKPTGTSFSIDKYGEEEAFRKALEARNNGVIHQREKEPLVFKPPEDVNQKIWRYLDFTKFVSLLETESLYFSNIDSLNDPFEGSFSKINEVFRPLIHKSEELTPEMITEKVKELRKTVYVNCWHMNDYESAAMWELYSKSNEAVCIQSSYESYQAEMAGRADVGVIQYINYDVEYIPEHDPYLAFLYKRKSFEHEHEIRGLLRRECGFGLGLEIPVDVAALVHRVYVSPSAPKWFFKLVEKMVKRYGYSFEVCQSSLSEEPFF